MKPVAIVILTSLVCVAALAAQQAPPEAFRSLVDLIALDVQVVDKSGAPIVNLGSGHFTVTIDGKRREVVSADLVSVDTTAVPDAPAVQTAPQAPRAAADAESGRVYILAFDAMSFQAAEIAPAREAARAFVSRLRPNDPVGLTVFPLGPTIDVTTDHQRVLEALGRIVGQADPASADKYQLSPSMVVDLTAGDIPQSTRDWDAFVRSDPLLANKLLAICHDPPERIFCIPDVVMHGRMVALSQEVQARDRLSSLRSMLKSLGGASKHKIVLLVSGGVMAADRSGGRPRIGDVGQLVGQAAAEVNAAVYTLYYDRLTSD